nr:hypothetical protein B0A51_11057 [Rachicladosporium sp. CCFEE 5018]
MNMPEGVKITVGKRFAMEEAAKRKAGIDHIIARRKNPLRGGITSIPQERQNCLAELYQTPRIMAPLARWAPGVATCCIDIFCAKPIIRHVEDAGWTHILAMYCRKGLSGTSTYGAEIEELVESFAVEGPGAKKLFSMTFVGERGPWQVRRQNGSGMREHVDVGNIAADSRVHHSTRDDGIINTSREFIVADKDRQRLLERALISNGNDSFAREQRNLYHRSLARKMFYVFDAKIDMTGLTDDLWRNRIRAANAAFRKTAINKILTSRQTCRETAAYMLRKLPKELVIMILKQQALLTYPRDVFLAKTPLPVLIREAAISLFPITKEPPTKLFGLALDVALTTIKFRLYASLIMENRIAIASLRSSTYENVRHITLSVRLQGESNDSGILCYPIELYQTARNMSTLAAALPKVVTCCLEVVCIRSSRMRDRKPGWVEVLGFSCRKEFKESSTYGRDLEILIEKFATEGPRAKKTLRMGLDKWIDGAVVDVSNMASEQGSKGADSLAKRIVRAATGLGEDE